MHFRVGGANFCCFFPQGNFLYWRGSFKGSESVRGNYALGEFGRNPKQNAFYISCIIISVSMLRVELLKVIVRGKFSPIFNFLEEIFVGRGGGLS